MGGRGRKVRFEGSCICASLRVTDELRPLCAFVGSPHAHAGVGNGAYLSVDYALACDTLPSKEHAAKFLGIWGVAAFIGTMMGTGFYCLICAFCVVPWLANRMLRRPT